MKKTIKIMALPYMVLKIKDRSSNISNVHHQHLLVTAPKHCPVCLSRIVVYALQTLADGVERKYRRCTDCNYRDRAVLYLEPAARAPD